MLFGDARVSTDGQSVAAPVGQLTAAPVRILLREVASGAKADCAQLTCPLGQLGGGEALPATTFNYLARSIRDLWNTLASHSDQGSPR